MKIGFSDFYKIMVSYYQDNIANNLTLRSFGDRTNRATNPLICEKEAIFYTVAYSWQHHQTMQSLLSNIDVTSNIAQKIRVIDYGCGQGVASLAYMDYLAEKGVAQESEFEVHLIEPSEVSLNIAKRLVRRLADIHGMRVTIHTQQCTLADATPALASDCSETVHLLGNVLYIASVQGALPALAQKINRYAGKNFLFATSPNYAETTVGIKLLEKNMDFADSFHTSHKQLIIYMYSLVEGNWTQRYSSSSQVCAYWENEASQTTALGRAA